MANISALIITLNEEKNIQRCIDSLVNVVDEILVLDSGSTDATLEICRRNPVRLISTQWKGYAATKNEGNKLLKYEWILSLDADEALSPDLQQAIREEKSKLQGLYRMNRLSNYCGHWIRHGGWYPDRKVRLFHRDQARWSGEYVHEQLQFDSNLPIQDLKGDLLHYSYYTLEEHKKRSLHYAHLGALKLMAMEAPIGLKKWFSPVIRFLKMFVFKAGFLDGYLGFKIAAITSHEVYLKYRWAEEYKRNPDMHRNMH